MVDYTKKKNDELKDLCKDRGLRRSGKKADLIKRLEDHDTEQSNAVVADQVTTEYEKMTWAVLRDLCKERHLYYCSTKATIIAKLQQWDRMQEDDDQLVQYIRSSGEQDDNSDLESVPSSVFLPELPTELRHRIYSLVLEEPEDIHIVQWSDGSRGTKRPVVRKGNHRDPKHRGEIYDRHKRTWVPPPHSSWALLGVSKSIRAETAPILYGRNTFIIAERNPLHWLRQFLFTIGPMTRHLRRIGLFDRHRGVWDYADERQYKKGQQAVEALLSARTLRTIKLNHQYVHHPPRTDLPSRIEEIVGVWEPILRSLQASYTAKGLRLKVCDVIQVVIGPCVPTYQGPHAQTCDLRDCGCDCDRRVQENEAMQKQVRDKVAEVLKLSTETKSRQNSAGRKRKRVN